jgi:hypothetical protein
MDGWPVTGHPCRETAFSPPASRTLSYLEGFEFDSGQEVAFVQRLLFGCFRGTPVSYSLRAIFGYDRGQPLSVIGAVPF